MVCNKCGQSLAENTQFCGRCGEAVPSPPGANSPTASSAPQPFATPEISGLAIGSLISGIFSFIFPAAIAAIVLGHIARSNIRKSAGRLTGNGMALAGLILGYMGLTFIPVLIIAAIAIPNLLRARIAANEASAVDSIRAFNSAEAAYAAAHPSTGYTCTISDLYKFTYGRLSEDHKNGYVFELTGCADSGSRAPSTKYVIVASPMTENQSGVRTFCSNETANIRASSGGSAAKCSED